jgi:hypothetical protein
MLVVGGDMKVFIANFGRANWLWPSCLDRSTVVTYEDDDLRPFWLAGDREGYIAKAMAKKKASKADVPIKPVVSRWFNLATIISSTEDDLWIHREKDELWWTISRPGDPEVTLSSRPDNPGERIYIIHKPASQWSNKSKRGGGLRWSALHPKARDFLFTEGTLQQLSEENAAYAMALIEGANLDEWHRRPVWKARSDAVGKGAATLFDAKQRAVVRMVMTAMTTVAGANGQQVLRTVKNKENGFGSQLDFERYVTALVWS